MKKAWLIIILILALLGFFVAIFIFINQEKLIDRFIQRQGEAIEFNYSLLDKNDGIKLVTVGTASPLPSDRAQTCYAIFVNGRFLLFDVGMGSSKKIEELRLPVDSLDGIFISQWQTDHYIDLPAVVNQSWLLGRQRKLDIYGPASANEVISGMNNFLNISAQERQNRYGEELFSIDEMIPIVQPISLGANDSAIIYDREGVRVTAFLTKKVDRFIYLGYKISYNNRHIVLAGEVSPSPLVKAMSQDVDLLVVEAMQADFVSRAVQLQLSKSNQRAADILAEYLKGHPRIFTIAEMARDVNAKKLILSHLAPTPQNPISRRLFTSGMKEVYGGPILLAEDGDLYSTR